LVIRNGRNRRIKKKGDLPFFTKKKVLFSRKRSRCAKKGGFSVHKGREAKGGIVAGRGRARTVRGACDQRLRQSNDDLVPTRHKWGKP